ncbi:amidohydrolase [Brevibacterium album]|uniref:amidohydrolase n=1 Tax=Brevibacterium album TaxID=417948 RepID=UPI000426EF56|nr:amidohydrolase [Brevibacterium album]
MTTDSPSPDQLRLFSGGRVHTFAEAAAGGRAAAHPHPASGADAILTAGGTVVATGTRDELRDMAGVRLAEEVDLGGRVILPGFTDAHLHAISTANTIAEVDLRQVRSLRAAVDTVAAHARTLPAGQWVTGGRWDSNTWDLGGAYQPDRRLLDEAVPERPVALWSIDYHTLWLNGAALAAVGIDDETPDPVGGEIVRDGSGRATGILREDAATIAERRMPALSLDQRRQNLLTAQNRWLAEGLTGLHDIDGAASQETWEALRAEDRQLMRVVKYLRLEELDHARESGWRTGDQLGRSGDRVRQPGAPDADGWFVRGGLKLFSDGALGSQTSHMTDPFPAHPGEDHLPNYGLPIASEDMLVEQLETAAAAGISAAVHAIGDRANHHVLAAFARTEEAWREARLRHGRSLRHRVEHAQFVRPEEVARFAELGIVASMQPRHCISDLHLLETLRPDPRLAAYAWKDLLAAGVPLAFGSDGPVEPTDPFAAIYAAMTRADISGDPATTFQAERRIPAWDAVAAHTSGAAYAAGLEGRTGALVPGQAADFIAVDVDPLHADGGSGVTGEYASEAALFEHALAVRDAQVQMTVVAGEVAFAHM